MSEHIHKNYDGLSPNDSCSFQSNLILILSQDVNQVRNFIFKITMKFLRYPRPDQFSKIIQTIILMKILVTILLNEELLSSPEIVIIKLDRPKYEYV